jgi:hypothetical protein
MQLLRSRKEAALGLQPSAVEDEKANTEEYEVNGRDLLTALVKANLDTDVPVSQRMSDEDVLARK